MGRDCNTVKQLVVNEVEGHPFTRPEGSPGLILETLLQMAEVVGHEGIELLGPSAVQELSRHEIAARHALTSLCLCRVLSRWNEEIGAFLQVEIQGTIRDLS